MQSGLRMQSGLNSPTLFFLGLGPIAALLSIRRMPYKSLRETNPPSRLPPLVFLTAVMHRLGRETFLPILRMA